MESDSRFNQLTMAEFVKQQSVPYEVSFRLF